MQAPLPFEALVLGNSAVTQTGALLIFATAWLGLLAIQTFLIYRDGRNDRVGLTRKRKQVLFTSPIALGLFVWVFYGKPFSTMTWLALACLVASLAGIWFSYWFAERMVVRKAGLSAPGGPAQQ